MRACAGTRLKKESLTIRQGQSIAERACCRRAAMDFFTLELGDERKCYWRKVSPRFQAGWIPDRLGLDYLSLDRPSATLSGGEAQRVRLATQIGSSLTGVLYILDEPSIGLHQKDNAALLALLKEVRERGNSVILVEHDRDAIFASDYVIDMGPGAGEERGRSCCVRNVARVDAQSGLPHRPISCARLGHSYSGCAAPWQRSIYKH